MAITISAEDTRSIKALELAAGAAQWLKCHTTDGVKAYGIRSRHDTNHAWLVTCTNCTCPDARRHEGQACKHQLVVRLHCELAKAQQSRREVKHAA